MLTLHIETCLVIKWFLKIAQWTKFSINCNSEWSLQAGVFEEFCVNPLLSFLMHHCTEAKALWGVIGFDKTAKSDRNENKLSF